MFAEGGLIIIAILRWNVIPAANESDTCIFGIKSSVSRDCYSPSFIVLPAEFSQISESIIAGKQAILILTAIWYIARSRLRGYRFRKKQLEIEIDRNASITRQVEFMSTVRLLIPRQILSIRLF